MPPARVDESLPRCLDMLCETFRDDVWMMANRLHGSGDARRLARLAQIGRRMGIRLLATNDVHSAAEAVTMLRAAILREPEAPEAYAQLAMAYGRKGDLANADLASAQAAFNRGDIMTARQLASRAKTRFPVGSPPWVQADDIASLKPPSARNN